MACCRAVRRTHGEYGLCRACDQRLEADVSAWAVQLSKDLDRLVQFDSYCAQRDGGDAPPSRAAGERGRVVGDPAGGDR